MDLQKLSKFIMVLGTIVMVPGIIICLSNLPMSAPPPQAERQFSWDNWVKQHSDPTLNVPEVYLINKDRANQRTQGYWFIGIGGVIIFAGFAVRKSAPPSNVPVGGVTGQAPGVSALPAQPGAPAQPARPIVASGGKRPCPHCGKEINNNAVACIHCHKEVPDLTKG